MPACARPCGIGLRRSRVLDIRCLSDTNRLGARLHFDQMKRLVGRALASGARKVSATRIVWDVSGDCQSPVYREINSRPDGRPYKQIIVKPGSAHGLTLELTLRCKRCERCLRLRAALWRLRALREWKIAPRTWFGTLTLQPEVQHKFLAQARAREISQGVDFDALSEVEQFRCRHREISREITKYLKRVRKEAAAPLRYLLVAEAHKSGAPHYHILVYEVDDARPVRQKTLRDQWTLGFSRWKLVEDEKAATYVCKYLNKDARARVRASVEFGLDVLERSVSVKVRSTESIDPPRLSELSEEKMETAHGTVERLSPTRPGQSTIGLSSGGSGRRPLRYSAPRRSGCSDAERLSAARRRTGARVLRHEQRKYLASDFVRSVEATFSYKPGRLRATIWRCGDKSSPPRFVGTATSELARSSAAGFASSSLVTEAQSALEPLDRIDHRSVEDDE